MICCFVGRKTLQIYGDALESRNVVVVEGPTKGECMHLTEEGATHDWWLRIDYWGLLTGAIILANSIC